jgi:hypothetical protein
MSFFTDSSGAEIVKQDTIELEGGGSIIPMPAGTNIKGAIEEAKFETNDNDGTYISLRWTVAAPELYAGRKVFQKLHVFATKAPTPGFCKTDEAIAKFKAGQVKKQDKAKRMFAVIDTNCGGKHIAAGEAPTDETLQQHLCGKMMMLQLDVWELDTERNGDKIAKADRPSGNWVRKVAPKGEYKALPAAELEAIEAKAQAAHNAALAAAPVAAPRAGTGSAPAADLGDAFDDDIPF